MNRRRQGVMPTIFMLFLAILYAVPLLWIVLTMFKTNSQILKNPTGIIFKPSFDNLANVFSAAIDSIGISIAVATMVTVLVVVIAVPAAYGIGRRMQSTSTAVRASIMVAFVVVQVGTQPQGCM